MLMVICIVLLVISWRHLRKCWNLGMLNAPNRGTWTLTPDIRCWEPKVLAMMSSHYEKQEPLPADLIEKIIKRCVQLSQLLYDPLTAA
jgi:hypothetical protein